MRVVGAVGLVLLAIADAHTADRCPAGIAPATAQHVSDALKTMGASTCAFVGVTTRADRLEATWSRDGHALASLTVGVRACLDDPPPGSGEFVLDAPTELLEACPAISVERIATLLRGERAARGAGDRPLFGLSIVVFSAIGILLPIRLRRSAKDPLEWAVMIAVFVLALAIRAWVPFSLSNWYAEVLPPEGAPSWMRFGPGQFGFQAILRVAGLWGPKALVWSQIVVGALAAPVLFAVVRALGGGIWAAGAAAMLLAFAPLHVRVSASPSEHVLASTLSLGFLLAWLDASHDGQRVSLILAVLLFAASSLTRVDANVQLCLFALWPTMRPVPAGAPSLSRLAPAVAGMAVFLGLAAVIAVRSHHPGPDLHGVLTAVRRAFPQFRELASRPPEWFSPSALLLATVGAAWMAFRRPTLVACLAGTILLGFAATGRLIAGDDLLSARYFLALVAVAIIAAGFGFEAIATLVPDRFRAASAGAALAIVGAWTFASGRPAYAVRYAFQDEYDFARAALAKLPPGCVVYEVPIRSDEFPYDVDCCLDVPRTPLALAFPSLELRELPRALAAVSDGSSCVAYYESIACGMQDDVPGGRRVREATAYFRRRCGEVHRRGRLEPIAETTVSPLATAGCFATRPRVALYRWLP